MAYTAIVSLINRLTGMLSDEELMMYGVLEDGVWSLLFMLKRVSPFVMDVQIRNGRRPEKVELMRELIELVNEAEDAIVFYVTMLQKLSAGKLNALQLVDRVIRQHTLSLQLISKIDGIKLKLKKWHNRCFSSTASSSVSRVLVEIKNHDMVTGLEDNELNNEVVTMMIEQLNNEDPRRDVISIVGPEGIGKTTLARRVYNHPTIVENFPCRLWISAYNIDYDDNELSIKELFQEIIKHPATTAAEDIDDGHHHHRADHQKMILIRDLALQTYKHLKNNRYLLVFDDVFRTQFWDDINIIFPDHKSGGGGRIIFTTRYDEVALYVCPRTPPFYMPPPLNKEESWKLFRDKASASAASSSTSTGPGPLVESQSQWKELVEACGGVPLAIVELAAQHLHLKSTVPVDHKEEVEEEDQRRIWELIYNCLPQHLKPCLLYLGVLNSCSSTQFKELIIADGLVQPTIWPPPPTPMPPPPVPKQKTKVEVKDYDIIAQEYLDELIKRNLVEVKSKRRDGSIKDIAISNKLQLMKFCRDKAREENFVEFEGLGSFPSITNRFAVENWSGNYMELFQLHPETPMKGRSVLILKDTNSTSQERNFDSYSLLQIGSPLRVLDIDVDLIHTIPDKIVRNLIYLRYLRLIFCGFESVHQTIISYRCNLEFLRIRNEGNKSLCLLQFWRMRKLINLSSSGVLYLPQPPPEYLDIGSDGGGGGGNKLVLDKLKRVKHVSVQSCNEDILKRMPNLVRLGVGGDIQHTKETISLLKWDVLLKNVTHLSFKRTRLVEDPMKILGKLPNLQVLKLAFIDIEGNDLNVCVTLDGGDVLFPHLKYMKLEKLEIRRWNLSVGSMPSLEILVIRNCGALEGLPSEALQKISTLRKLEVYNYSSEAVEKDAFRIRDARKDSGSAVRTRSVVKTQDPLQLRLERKSAWNVGITSKLSAEKINRFFNAITGWELRSAVLLSLFFQILLIFLGDRRKLIKKRWWVQIFLWIAYLCADWVAGVALGILSHSAKLHEAGDLQAFWAPFLLLHLGGPDTITAFALEDNELWLRHLLGLVVQGSLASYVTFKFWNYTMVSYLSVSMYVPAIIKYGERTWVLNSASKEQLRDSMLDPPDPGPNYAKFMDEYNSKDEEGFRVTIEKVEENPETLTWDPSSQGIHSTNGNKKDSNDDDDRGDDDDDEAEAEIIARANHFFQIFKRLFAFLILSFDDWNESKVYFQQISWRKAFKLIDVELEFMFDMLYTKATLVHSLKAGSILRSISLIFTIVVSIIFLKMVDKQRYPLTDAIITTLLLTLAIILDIVAALISISSDSASLSLRKLGLVSLANFLLRCRRKCKGWRRRTSKRWSNSVAQYNLLSTWLKAGKPPKDGKPRKRLRGIRKQLRNFRSTEYKNVTDELKKFIFIQLREKSKKATDFTMTKQLCSSRGGAIFQEKKNGQGVQYPLEWCTDKVEFDQSVLIWHIATDLCYHHDDIPEQAEMLGEIGEMCKLLSDYMVYLLLVCPFMLPEGIGEIRSVDTEKEAINFFQEKKISTRINTRREIKEACESLLKVKTDIPPIEVKGPKSKSVLFDACRLARQLLDSPMSPKEKRWEIIRLVWVEMVSYAAAQCRGPSHAKQLGQGGELLTHV